MEEKQINLIIIDDSFDTEEKIVSTLRNEGFAARSSRVEDEEDLVDAIRKKEPDLVLYTRGMELISLAETCRVMKEQVDVTPIPVIAVQKQSSDEATIAEAMREGAADLSSYDNMDHLRLVILRELNAVRNWKTMNRLQKQSSELERRCNSLLDSSRDAIAYVHEGMHVYSNDSYLELFSMEQFEDLEGMPILDMVAINDRDEFKTFLREYQQSDAAVATHKTSLLKADGSEFEGEMEFSPASIEGEPCIQVIIRKEGINSEELAQMEARIMEMSQRDQATGLYNRQYCLDKLEETITRCEEEGCSAALIEIKLDNLEDIKKNFGVSGIEKLNREVADELSKLAGENDVLAFMYSHFTLIAYGQTMETVEAYAKQFQTAVMDLVVPVGDDNINTTCTIAIAIIDRDSPQSNDILDRAERAYMEAVERGTNQLQLYIPKKGELTRHEVDARFKEQLTNALKNDRFVLHYQPIISLHGDTDERYEVFVRLSSEDSDELIMPQDFLPAAERIGMSIAIDRWVLYRVIKDLDERWKSGKRTHFFIKLSAPSIRDETLPEWISFQMKDKSLPDNALIFEVKESVAVTNLKHARELSMNLRKINCGFVLDDFGSGTNPFQLLEHIDVDYVRLDKIFMDDLAENPQNQEAIKSITDKASSMGKFTIAQFVKDANSLSILWGMGVNFIQGYFLQEPLPDMNYDFTEMTG